MSKIVYSLVLFATLLLSVLYAPLASGWGAEPKVYYFFLGVSILVVFLPLYQGQSDSSYKLARMDILVIIAALYVILRQIVLSEGFVHDYIFTLSAAGMVYLLRRRMKSCGTSCFAFIVAALAWIEILYSLPALFALLAGGRYRPLKLTGTLMNSGILAMTLAVSFPAFLYLHRYYLRKRCLVVVWCCRLGMLFSIIMIVYVQSRMAGVMTIVSIALYGLHQVKSRIVSRWLTAGIAAGVVILSLLFSVAFKSGSATGRVLIWKASLPMLLQQPLWGLGPGAYSTIYLDYQEAFFRQGLHNESFQTLASDNFYAFNDWLQTAIEWGIVGLALLLVICFYALRAGYLHCTPQGKLRADMLLVLCTGTLYSYPLQVQPLLLIFFMILAETANEDKYEIVLSGRLFRKVRDLFPPFIAGMAYWFYAEQFNGHQQWVQASRLILEDENRGLKMYADLYPQLCCRGPFLYNYGAELYEAGRYDSCILLLRQASRSFNHTDLHLYLAKAYENKGRIPQAIAAYQRVIFMTPGRFYPRYLLAKLYARIGDKAKARQMALQIMAMPVKIPSREVSAIKISMEHLLKNLCL